MPHEINYPGRQHSSVQVWAQDEPGPGGAAHFYTIEWPGLALGSPNAQITALLFQRGPIKEVGVNGITNEALLAVVVDRLQSFQKGGFSCRENAIALTKIEEALHWMQHRTEARIARGVEGETKV